MSEQHPIRNGIIATVAGGIVLWILGALWTPAGDVREALWGLLWDERVTIPVGVMVLGGVVIVLTLWTQHAMASVKGLTALAPKRQSQSVNDDAASSVEETSEYERGILKVIARADGASVERDTLRAALDSTNLRVQAAVERLEEVGLVDVWEGDIYGDNFVVALTAVGRQYVVSHDWA